MVIDGIEVELSVDQKYRERQCIFDGPPLLRSVLISERSRVDCFGGKTEREFRSSFKSILKARKTLLRPPTFAFTEPSCFVA